MNAATQAHASLAATAAALFAAAAAEGRDALALGETTKLLGGLEIPSASAANGSAPVELHIRLDNTREFGMVISAGIVAGDSIAVSGAFTLKSRQLKSQMGEGHAH